MPENGFSLRSGLAVWLTWSALFGLLLAQLVFRVWHPHFLPVTGLLALFLGTSLWFILRGITAIARGPERRRRVGVFLIGLAPVGLATGHVMYGFSAAHSRRVRLDFFQKWLIPFGESLIDLEGRFRYPQRTVGEKVVMVSEPVDDAAEQVKAMDAHIRALEKRLRSPIEGRVHWFRGPLLEMQGRAIFGVCMGSRAADSNPDLSGLDPLDQHEVAHCVINHHCSLFSEPPALLSEGWAQANMGRDPLDLASDAWSCREDHAAMTLAELTGPDWAGRHEWPVYAHGAPLANYLLETFGPDRFLELYTTCRRAHFSEDCRRIFGVDLDQIDHDYWNEIEALTTGSKPTRQRRLGALRRVPEIDEAAWLTFLDDYFAAIPKLLAPFDSARISLQSTTEGNFDPLGRTSPKTHVEFVRQGEFRIMRLEEETKETVVIAGPAESQRFRRRKGESSWVPESQPLGNAREARQWARIVCDGMLGLSKWETILTAPDWRGHDPMRAILTGFERFEVEGKRFVRVRFRWEPRAPAQIESTIAFVISVGDGYRLRSVRYDVPPYVAETEQQHVEREGALVEIRRVIRESDGDAPRQTTDQQMTIQRINPLPPEMFTAAAQLDGPIESPIVSPAGDYSPPRLIWDWYWLPLVLALASPVCGAVLLRRSIAR